MAQARALALALLVLAVAPAAARAVDEGRRLTADSLVGLARAWVLDRYGAELTGATIEPLGMPRELPLPAGHTTTTLSLQGGSPTAGHLIVLVEAVGAGPVGTRGERSTTVVFRVHAEQEVVVAVRDLPRGTVIGSADLRGERRPAERARGALADPAQAVGKEVVRPVAPGEIVLANALATPRVVRRGAVVSLVLEGQGFRIVARGVAQEDGSRGQVIRVVNQTSRRELAGRVEDERTVRIAF